MLRLHRLAFLPLVALALAAPAQPSAPEPAAAAPPASAMDGALMYQLLLAELKLNQEEPATAYSLMLDAARRTDDERLYHRAVDIALQSHAGDAALAAARAWKDAQPASQDANGYLLQILIGMNRIRDTLEPLKFELASIPEAERAQSLGAVARQFARAGDKKAAAAVVEQALAPDLASPATAGAAWGVVGRMRLLAGDFAGTLAAASKLQRLEPNAIDAALLGLELMEQKQSSGEALLQAYLQTAGSADMRMAYARLLMQTQRYADAATQVRLVIGEKPDHEAAWLTQGALQLQNREYEQAQSSLQRYLALLQAQAQDAGTPERERGSAQAYLYLVDIATARKDYEGAEGWLKRIEVGQDVMGVQTRRATLLARRGLLDEARALIRALPGDDPQQARSRLLIESQLLRDAKQYRGAYDLLRAAMATAGAEADTELLYEQAMLAEKLGEMGEMERLLRTLMRAQPDYHHAYNALGYSLADRNLRLPEAKQLIQKALEFAPGDPFISDSLGWVEFRLGRKSEAARILETAYRAHPDAEIAAHLGEVLWSLGQKGKALEFWKEGLRLNSDSETMGETLKRLQVKW